MLVTKRLITPTIMYRKPGKWRYVGGWLKEPGCFFLFFVERGDNYFGAFPRSADSLEEAINHNGHEAKFYLREI